jgi:endonuclease VIII
MPEGPSIVILKEEVLQFKGRKVLSVEGNSKEDIERLKGKTVKDFRSWGKHFLICFNDFTVRIHFLLFGRYRVNERKDSPPRLSLKFTNGELNFYACSVKFIEDNLDEVYDWSADVMADEWNEKAAIKKLKEKPQTLACDALLNQDIFAGSGNIIKNEVLFRIRVHPESKIGDLPATKLKEMAKEACNYSFDFYNWKKVFELKKHYQVHTKKICPRCDIPLIYKKNLGKANRTAFYCEVCQVKY